MKYRWTTKSIWTLLKFSIITKVSFIIFFLIRLRAQVFYERIVDEAKPSLQSLVDIWRGRLHLVIGSETHKRIIYSTNKLCQTDHNLTVLLETPEYVKHNLMTIYGLTDTWLYEARLRHISRALAVTATVGRWGIDAGSVTRLNAITARCTALSPISPLSIVTINWKPTWQKQTKISTTNTTQSLGTTAQHNTAYYLILHTTSPQATLGHHIQHTAVLYITTQYSTLTAPRYVTQDHSRLQYITLDSKTHHIASHYPALRCAKKTLYIIVLLYTRRHDDNTTLCYNALHCSAMHSTSLHCNTMQCNALQLRMQIST